MAGKVKLVPSWLKFDYKGLLLIILLLILLLILSLILAACSNPATPGTNGIGAVPANTPAATITPAPQSNAVPGSFPVYGSPECNKIAKETTPWPPLKVPSLADYVDALYFGGIEYMASYFNTRDTFEVGPEFGRVKYQESGYEVSPGWQCLEGVAAAIEPNTPVYSVKGYSPQFRLAVRSNEGLKLYEMFTRPGAKTGSDLWDIGGKTQYIGINTKEDGKTEITSIKEVAQVDRLVDAVLKAPITVTPGTTYMLRYFIAFHLKDGTVTQLAYTDAGELRSGSGVKLPQEVNKTIEETIKAVPPAVIASLTPTPKVQPGKAVNLAQDYQLDQASSILLKFARAGGREITDKAEIKRFAVSLDKAIPTLDSSLYPIVITEDVAAIIFKLSEDRWTILDYDRKAGILQLYANEEYNRVTISAPPEFIKLLNWPK